MCALPSVNVSLSNGNLGRTGTSQDGTSGIIVSGIAVSGQFALGDVVGPYTSIADAEANGIDAAYDTANTCMAYHHIKAFFDQAPAGTKLYVMVVAKTVVMTDLCDVAMDYAKKLLVQTAGAIKLIGITRIPDVAYTPTYSGQFETDLSTALTKLQALVESEFALHRPVRAIIEGRNFQGVVSTTRDLRSVSTGPNANAVMVMIGQDNDVAASLAAYEKYAAVGTALGRAAAIPVQRNLGRVKDGDIGITNAGLSNGALLSTLSDQNVSDLNDKGYVFLRSHAQKAGFFFNDDHTACPITDDFGQLSLGRVADKAASIAYLTYLEELLDEVQIDATTGKLALPTVKHYQGEIEQAIIDQMPGEISSVECFIDPDQKLLSNSNLQIQLDITPVGTNRTISVTLALVNPSN